MTPSSAPAITGPSNVVTRMYGFIWSCPQVVQHPLQLFTVGRLRVQAESHQASDCRHTQNSIFIYSASKCSSGFHYDVRANVLEIAVVVTVRKDDRTT